jgi:hypothetical protein
MGLIYGRQQSFLLSLRELSSIPQSCHQAISGDLETILFPAPRRMMRVLKRSAIQYVIPPMLE